MMRLFTLEQSVKIAPEIIHKARLFASGVVKTIDYRDSSQTNLKKIENDHFTGKIGEEAVRSVFEKFGRLIKGPDYEIYDLQHKSWETDLYVDDVELAVKTQKRSAAQHYGLSWTFQASRHRKDSILKQPGAWVCFVECDDRCSNWTCTVYPPYQMKEIKPLLRDPKLVRLKGKKLVIYAKDLPPV